jgi:hypothetical protein
MAEVKIASHWSDGHTIELKTYALACPACQDGLLQLAREKQSRCRLAPGERLDPPQVFDLRGAQLGTKGE